MKTIFLLCKIFSICILLWWFKFDYNLLGFFACSAVLRRVHTALIISCVIYEGIVISKEFTTMDEMFQSTKGMYVIEFLVILAAGRVHSNRLYLLTQTERQKSRKWNENDWNKLYARHMRTKDQFEHCMEDVR